MCICWMPDLQSRLAFVQSWVDKGKVHTISPHPYICNIYVYMYVLVCLSFIQSWVDSGKVHDLAISIYNTYGYMYILVCLSFIQSWVDSGKVHTNSLYLYLIYMDMCIYWFASPVGRAGSTRARYTISPYVYM